MNELSPTQIERFRAVVYRRLGLSFEDAKLGMLADVLRRRLGATGTGYDEYVAHLEEAAREELGALAEDLTVTETYFFRGREQLQAFSEVAVPDCLARRPAQPLRILSAGCSSGEEPYTLVMLLRERGIEVGAQASVVAADINPAALARAKAGEYTAWAMRETPADMQRRWFEQHGRTWRLDPVIRNAVRFEHANLAAEDPLLWAPASYDIVFCRNVLMYFAPDRMQAVVAKIARALRPGGYFFLGYAETLRGVSHDFHLRHSHGAFYYQRKSTVGAAPAPVLPRAPAAEEVALATVVDASDSWIDVIQHAGERVRKLSERARPAAAEVPARSWDLGPPLELLRRERFADALDAVARLPSESGDDPDVLLLRAMLEIHHGDLTAAEATSRRLLTLDELAAGAHYVLALCREAAGDRQGAIEHDQVAVYLDPAFAMPRLHLGLQARRSGDLESARRDLARALALLEQEDASRLLLFGGGFGRAALLALCRTELIACGGTP